MLVRLAREGDEEALLTLVRTFHAKVHPPYNEMATLTGMVKPGGWLFVAEIAGEVRGYIWLTAKGNREAFLEQIYADEAMVEGFERVIIPLLRHYGFALIETVVLREGWRRMLERWGFKPTGVVMERVIDIEAMKHVPTLPEAYANATIESTGGA